MAYDRRDRVAEELKKEVTDIVTNLKDPRIPPVFSIIHAEVSRDFRTAKIRFSILGDEEARKACSEALKSANGLIRKELSVRMRIHHTPSLQFISDDSIAYSVHIGGIMNQIKKQEEDKLS